MVSTKPSVFTRFCRRAQWTCSAFCQSNLALRSGGGWVFTFVFTYAKCIIALIKPQTLITTFCFVPLHLPLIYQIHLYFSISSSKIVTSCLVNPVLLRNDIPWLTLLGLHAPRHLQGYSLKLAGRQILQHSCHKLLMDDATLQKGCGCLPPEARITDGQWALPLNICCPWLVCLLTLYQWLCKICIAIIHTDE